MVKVQSPNLWITKEVPSGVFFFPFFFGVLGVASGGYSWLWCVGFSLQGLLMLCTDFKGTQAFVVGVSRLRVAICGLESTGSITVGHWLSCSAACGILPEQGLDPCLLHWQADSSPLSRQRNPPVGLFNLTQ